MWFEAHLRARRAVAAQEGDRIVARGPAMPAGASRSQMRSSADVQSKSSAWSCEDATSVRRHDDHDTSMQPPAAKEPAHELHQQPQPVTAAGHGPDAQRDPPSWHAAAAASPTAEPPPAQRSPVCSFKRQLLSQSQQAQSLLAANNLSVKAAANEVVNSDRKIVEHDGHDSAPEQDSRRSSSTVDNHSSADEHAACDMVVA